MFLGNSVSVAVRMPLVLGRNKFAEQTCSSKMYTHGCTFLSDGTDVRGTPQKRMYFTLP